MKVAILGCAHMHSYGYASELKKLGCEIIGIYDHNTDAGTIFADKNQVAFYSSAEELLSLKPDAAVVCSENVYHKKYSLLAAERGIHVIVEKPIATTIEDAEEMIACCKANNVLLMVCFPVRYCTPVKDAKFLIDNGQTGDILSITATNHGMMPNGWFIDKELSGGGAGIDHTVHVADIMHWILKSDVKEVYAVMETLFHDVTVDDCGHILLEFDNGTIGSIDFSWNRPKSFPTWGDVTLEINGSKRSISVDAFSEQLTIYSNTSEKSAEYYSFGSNMDYEMLMDFKNAIENGNQSPITGEDGLFALKVALMAYRANSHN